jgi:hypothetical protein
MAIRTNRRADRMHEEVAPINAAWPPSAHFSGALPQQKRAMADSLAEITLSLPARELSGIFGALVGG